MLIFHCKCNTPTQSLKIEGDFTADPIWCSKCNLNIDISTIPLSQDLIQELIAWTAKWGEWIDIETDMIVINGLEMEMSHNKWGEELTQRVQGELGNHISVVFSPSATVEFYSEIGRVKKK